jgi:hypothetical protein
MPRPTPPRARVTRQHPIPPRGLRNELARVEERLLTCATWQRPMLLGARLALRWAIEDGAARPSEAYTTPTT